MNRNRVTLPLILLIAAVGLTACKPAPTESLAEPIATLSPTLTPSPIALPTATPTATPTASPTPTFTPTPTPITLPVTNGTPIPDLPYEVITVENVQRLRQIARYGYPRLLQGQPYRLTADGRIIAVGTTLGPEFYDAQTQAKIGGFEVEFLRDFDLSADGRYVLTLAGEDALTVWTQDGKEVRAFDLPIGDAWALKAVALSPDGTLLAVQRKKADWQEADKVDVYRVADGRLVDTVRGEGAVFSPDGQYLATLFDGLRLYPVAELGQGWEKRLPKQSLPWCGATEGNCGLVFSPDGTLAALVRAARVEVYRVAERRLIRQVSGWESDNYTLPQVQFGMDGGRMLITTPALYDGQGNVRVRAQTIVVDVASGEWLSRGEAPEGLAYLDGGQVRTFRWQAEGEMPQMYQYKITAGFDKEGRLNLYTYGQNRDGHFGLVRCVEEFCDVTPFTIPINKIPIYDDALEEYILQFSPKWVLLHDGKETSLQYSGHSFAVPNAKIVGNLLVIWAASSSNDSEITIFDKTSGKRLYRFDAYDFSSYGNKIYLWGSENFIEVGEKDEKHQYPDICGQASSQIERMFCVIIGTSSSYKRSEFKDALDFDFLKENLLVVNYSDGLIRVWGVVPVGTNVK
jgi:hypothetical protein